MRRSEKAIDFWGLVKVVHRLASEGRSADAGLAAEMFQTAQWASASEAAASLAQMAARGAKGDPALAALVRDRQDLVGEWQKRDQARSAAVSQAPDKRDRAAEGANVARLAAIDARIGEIDRRLAADFPDYAALARPQPLGVEQVQAELRADEALVLFLDTPEWRPTPEETFIWVVTKTDMRWVRTELGTQVAQTRGWRAPLRASMARSGGAVKPETSAWTLLKGIRRKWKSTVRLCDVLPFDLERAHDALQGAARSGRGHDQGQASARRAVGTADQPAVAMCWSQNRPRPEFRARLRSIARWLGSPRASPSPCCRRWPRSKRCASSPRPAGPTSLTSASAIRCSTDRRTTPSGASTTRSRPRPPAASSNARGRPRQRIALGSRPRRWQPLPSCSAAARPTSSEVRTLDAAAGNCR